MDRALARAAGKATPESQSLRTGAAGSAAGSAQGTAASAEEGDAYFTAVHDAILEQYVVPSVISERERLYLAASVLAYIGPDAASSSTRSRRSPATRSSIRRWSSRSRRRSSLRLPPIWRARSATAASS